ncbi:MAG: proprotein convertase P-domain-containing protein [Candidatus Magnetomorum sp.]|nr:proprotein convertase P-domain-containing protein [Candidatus Magnetomorum sp.]
MKKGIWLFFFSLLMVCSYGYADQSLLQHVSTWPYQSTSAIDSDLENDILFVGTGNLIVILDAGNPINKKEINTITMDAFVTDLFYKNDHLFVTNEDKGFIIFDISDVEHPKDVFRQTMCYADRLHTNGKYAGIIMSCTLLNDGKNLSMFQISSPQETVEVNRVKLSGLSEIVDLFIENQIVYVIDIEEGINVYDLNEIIDPGTQDVQMIGVYDRPGNPKHIHVRNQLAYVSDFDAGFCIIDYSNPECPQERSCKEEIETAVGSALMDNHAFVATYNEKLWALNIEDPDNIEVIETVNLLAPAYKIFATNNHVYVIGYDQVFVYQCVQGVPTPQFIATPQNGYAPLTVSYSNTTAGTFLSSEWNFDDGYTSTTQHPVHTYKNSGHYTVTLAINDGKQWYSEVKTNYITVHDFPPMASFVSNVQSGISPLYVHFTQTSKGQITDVLWDFGDTSTSTAMNPVHVYTRTGLFSVQLTVYGSGGTDSVTIKDYITVKNNVTQIAQWDAYSISTLDIDSERSIAFVATPRSIEILNVINPLDIQPLDSISLENPAESLFYTRNFLYAACGDDGLKIFNTSTSDAVTMVAQTSVNGFANHVWGAFNYAYVSTLASFVSVISLSPVTSPCIVSTIDTVGNAHAMKLIEHKAFIAEGDAGISYYKQLGATEFVKQSCFEGNGQVVQFEYNPKGLFLAAKESGLLILNIDDTSNELIQIGSAPETMQAIDVAVHNDYAFVACGPDGLRILDTKQTEEPTEIMFFPSRDSCNDVVDAFPYLYLADGKGGLRIFVQAELNQLTIQTPEILKEDINIGQVCLPFISPKDVTVHLSSSEPEWLSMPESVNITRGQCSNFAILVKDALIQDDMDIIFTATAEGWLNAQCNALIKKEDTYEIERRAKNLPMVLPDLQEIRLQMTLSDIGKINHLKIRIKVQHRHFSDIQAYLISPQNKWISLFGDVNIIEVTDIVDLELDDDAIRDISEATFPVAGQYRPKAPLSSLNGLDVKGTWTLFLRDTRRSDGGLLLNWSMIFDLNGFENSPPVARPDQAETDRRSTLTIPVLANDYDPNNDLLSITGMTSPQWGMVQLSSDEKDVVYIPSPMIERVTADTFKYSISDGKATAQSMVTVQISDFFICNDTPMNILKASPEGLMAQIDIPLSSAIIQDMNVKLSIDHPRLIDLTASLISPLHNRIVLFEHIGEGQETFENIVFNDEADRMIDQVLSPFTGSFKPMESLGEFDGDLLSGTWKINITDEGDEDDGRLMSFELHIFYSGEPPVTQNVHLLPVNPPSIADHIFSNRLDSLIIPRRSISSIKPRIQITDMPKRGNRIKPLKGQIRPFGTISGYLLVYIFTDSWHLKPRMETPFTEFLENGSWQCDITTKPGDETASQIAVFLFSDKTPPVLIESLPVLPKTFFQKALSYEIKRLEYLKK